MAFKILKGLEKIAVGTIIPLVIATTPFLAKAESQINDSYSKKSTSISQEIKKEPIKQEITILGGMVYDGKQITSTSTSLQPIQLEYSRGNYSASYLNLGPFSDPKNHMDGLTFQYFKDLNELGMEFIPKGYFYAGAGAYFYANTTEDESNVHGIGGIGSLKFKYPLTKNLSGEIRANSVFTREKNAVPIFIGLSYNFEPLKDFKENTNQELILFPAGVSITNSNSGENSFAYGTEYRWNSTENLDTIIGFSDAGERSGINFQLRAKTRLNNKFSLSLGGGICSADKINPMVSVALDYDLSKQFGINATWSRRITPNNNDFEDIMLGIGYKF